MALLTAQILGSDIVGVDISVPPKSWAKEPFRIADTVVSPYADISSIANWEKFGHRKELKRDYGFVRQQIKILIQNQGISTTITTINDLSSITKVAGDRYLVGDNPVGELADHPGAIAIVQPDLSFKFYDTVAVGYWNLSLVEKEIAVRYNLGDLNDHEADFKPEQVLEWNAEYHQESTSVRFNRRLYAETLVYRDLPDYGNDAVMAMVYSPVGNLVARYADYGQKGTVEDQTTHNPTPTPGICDYLLSRSVFAPEGSYAGMSAQPWTTRKGTLGDLITRIYNVLVYGIYE